MKVIKRDGREVEFQKSNIEQAIKKAFYEVEGSELSDGAKETTERITNRLCGRYKACREPLTVEGIQEDVETELMREGAYDVAKAYIKYRYLHNMARDQYKDLMDAVSEKLSASNVVNQNANVDERSFGGRKGEAANLVSKKFALERCMSKMARDNHINNMIYIHDLDSYSVGMHNCLSVPFDDLLANGFTTRQTDVRPAQSIGTAFQLVAVIFQLQSLQQFGGVSATHLDHTMVPYVRKSFYKHFKEGLKYINNISIKGDIEKPEEMSIEDSWYAQYPEAMEYARDMTVKETYQAVEGMYHNLNIWAA